MITFMFNWMLYGLMWPPSSFSFPCQRVSLSSKLAVMSCNLVLKSKLLNEYFFFSLWEISLSCRKVASWGRELMCFLCVNADSLVWWVTQIKACSQKVEKEQPFIHCGCSKGWQHYWPGLPASILMRAVKTVISTCIMQHSTMVETVIPDQGKWQLLFYL